MVVGEIAELPVVEISDEGATSKADCAKDIETPPIAKKDDASLPSTAGAFPLSFCEGSDATRVLVGEGASTRESSSHIGISPSAAVVVPGYILLHTRPVPLAFRGNDFILERRFDISLFKNLIARTICIAADRDIIVRGKSLTASEIHLIAGRDVCLTDVTLKANRITIDAPGAIRVNGLVQFICQNLDMTTKGRPAVQRVEKSKWDYTVR